MTNEQKYKTAEERVRAFEDWCNDIQVGGECHACKLSKIASHWVCFAHWLNLEAEKEKTEPCPFCGGETHNNLGHLKVGVVHYWVDCISPDCMYRSAHYTDKDEAIAAHNRVAKAVRAAEKGWAK